MEDLFGSEEVLPIVCHECGLVNGCEHYCIIQESPDDSINLTEETVAEMLISFVSLRPAIWDHRLPLVQRTKPIKDQLWLEIYREFGVTDLTPAVLQKKWKNLRDKFIKTKAEVELYIPTGSSALKRKKVWKHYEAMGFLNDSVSPRVTSSSYTTPTRLSSPAPSTTGTSPTQLASPLQNNDEFSDRSIHLNRSKRKQKDGTSEAILKAINAVSSTPSNAEKHINPICQRISDLLDAMPARERTELEIELLCKTYEAAKKYMK